MKNFQVAWFIGRSTLLIDEVSKTHRQWFGRVASVWLIIGMMLGSAGSSAFGADIKAGEKIYQSHCVSCHGSNGRGVVPGVPDLARGPTLLKPDSVLVERIRSGGAAMPGYLGVIPERDFYDLVAYLRQFL